MGLLSKSDQPSREQALRQNENSQAAIQGLKHPDENTASDKTELLEELSESDLLDSIDDPALRNLATKDIPTSNFDEGETEEFGAYVDVALMKKRARHPHEGQDITGTLREWVHDDPNAGLDKIDKGDRQRDETFGQAVKARVAKAKNGSLVRRVLSSIRHSVVRRENENESGGGRLLERFGK